jgi:tetrahydromethanopterin S-methyltransferase subunit C
MQLVNTGSGAWQIEIAVTQSDRRVAVSVPFESGEGPDHQETRRAVVAADEGFVPDLVVWLAEVDHSQWGFGHSMKLLSIGQNIASACM